jgi:hypothetical protein
LRGSTQAGHVRKVIGFINGEGKAPQKAMGTPPDQVGQIGWKLTLEKKGKMKGQLFVSKPF